MLTLQSSFEWNIKIVLSCFLLLLYILSHMRSHWVINLSLRYRYRREINLVRHKNYSTIFTSVLKPCDAWGYNMHTLISNRTRGSLQKYIYMKTIERFAAYCRFAPKSFTHLTWFCIELSFHAVSFMTALARFWRFSLRIPWRNVQPYLLEKRSTGQYRAGFVGNVSGLICSALICNPVTYPF